MGTAERAARGGRQDRPAVAEQLHLGLDAGLPPPCRELQRGRRVGSARRSPVAVSVDLFHRLFGLPSRRTPGTDGVPDELLRLRVDLIREEAEEFADAAAQRDLQAMADALADLVYVTYGAAVTLGIDLDDVVAEVHESNLTKLGPDGRPVMRGDGKVLKPPGYRPPDVERVLAEQPPLPWPVHRNSTTSSTPSPA